MIYPIEPRVGESVENVESGLRILVDQSRGQNVHDVVLRDALTDIHTWALEETVSLLKRWHVPNYEDESEERVQQWYVELYSKSLDRCDLDRPLIPYFYRILRRCCSSAVREHIRSPFCQQECEQSDARRSWLEAMAHTDIVAALEEELPRLPAKLRAAVERWLFHCETGLPPVFGSELEQRRFHNHMFRTRCRLKRALLARFDCV